MTVASLWLSASLALTAPPTTAPTTAPSSTTCGPGLSVQVLGSGGPEARAGRASSSYLVRVDGVARILVDAGSGAMLRFGESGADLADLDTIVLSHLHTDHAGDVPALLKALQFSRRRHPLDVVGPAAGGGFPGLRAFLGAQLGPGGAWPYLGGHLDGTGGRVLVRPREVTTTGGVITTSAPDAPLQVSVSGVPHGPVPTLAVRVSHGDRSVVFGSDHNGDDASFAAFARGADVLVAHHAIATDSDTVAARLHATPAELGRLAHEAGVGRLVLSHLMARSEPHLDDSIGTIRRSFGGDVVVAADLACITVASPR